MESRQFPSWKITPDKVEAAIKKIVQENQPIMLILFGSYVEGKTGADSDLDILVVVDDSIENPRKESVKIRRSLRGILMPMDILVVPRSQWEKLKKVSGMIYREAFVKGKVVYESKEKTSSGLAH